MTCWLPDTAQTSNELDRVLRHCFIQVRELVLMHLGMLKEDLFTLLLQCGHFHHLTDVATLKVAVELYLMPHELVHWHEGWLLGHTKPADQLVANFGEPSNSLKVVPDTLIEARLHTICIVWTSLCNDAGPLGQAYVVKALTHEVEQQWTIVLLRIR